MMHQNRFSYLHQLMANQLRLCELKFKEKVERYQASSVSNNIESLCPNCPLTDSHQKRYFTYSGDFAAACFFEGPQPHTIELQVRESFFSQVTSTQQLSQVFKLLLHGICRNGLLSSFRVYQKEPQFDPDFSFGDSYSTIEGQVQRCFYVQLEFNNDILNFKFVCVPDSQSLASLASERSWCQESISYCPVCDKYFVLGRLTPLTRWDSSLPRDLWPIKALYPESWTILDVLNLIQTAICSKKNVQSSLIPRIREESQSICPRSYKEPDIRKQSLKLFDHLLGGDYWFEAGLTFIDLGMTWNSNFIPPIPDLIDHQKKLWSSLHSNANLSSLQNRKFALVSVLQSDRVKVSRLRTTFTDSDAAMRIASFMTNDAELDDFYNCFEGDSIDDVKAEILNTLFFSEELDNGIEGLSQINDSHDSQCFLEEESHECFEGDNLSLTDSLISLNDFRLAEGKEKSLA